MTKRLKKELTIAIVIAVLLMLLAVLLFFCDGSSGKRSSDTTECKD